MATFSTTTVGGCTPRPRAQLRVARAERLRCAYSNEGVKACSAMNLSLAVLKRMQAMERQQSSRPWSPGLTEQRMDTEDTRLRRLSRAMNPESLWLLASLLGYILRRRR